MYIRRRIKENGRMGGNFMTRLEMFRSFKNHPLMKRAYKRLSSREIEECEMFLFVHGDLDYSEFNVILNRWYLDAKNKPKRFKEMWILVCEANGHLINKRRTK